MTFLRVTSTQGTVLTVQYELVMVVIEHLSYVLLDSSIESSLASGGVTKVWIGSNQIE